MIKVAMTSVYVDDVTKAHAFYTDVLGFETRTHMDLGGGTLFVTVGAREGAQQDLQLLLEPGRYKWMRVSNADIGEPGCKHWHVRPRLGMVGMLAGWWHVKVSSGCPLAGGPWHPPWSRSLPS